MWDRAAIDEGSALITHALSRLRLGPYQLQAAIAALHAEAAGADHTDWPQIVTLYEVLHAIAPNPMAGLGHVVALAEVKGPAVGLAELATLDDKRLSANHRLHAVRAHLLEQQGESEAARSEFLAAATLTESEAERAYLAERAACLPPT